MSNIGGGVTKLYSVSRISNGWLVKLHGRYDTETDAKVVMCGTWSEVEDVCKGWSFPFPNKEEPRS